MSTNSNTLVASLCPVISAKKWICEEQTALPALSIEMHNFTGIENVPAQMWESLLCDSTCFLQQNYLKAIEESIGNPENFRYCVVRQQDKTLLIAACQIIKFDIKQTYNYTKEAEVAQNWWGKVKNNLSHQLKYLAENIDVQLLVCGNTFLSGENAFMYDSHLSEKEAAQLLTEALENLRKEEAKKGKNIRAILIKDFFIDAEHPESTFNAQGYHTFKAEPIMQVEIVWDSFEAYSQALSSKYRQRMKSAYKKSQVLQRREMSLADMEQWNEVMYTFFESVVKKAGFNLKETPKNYFLSLKKYLGDSFPVYGYFKDEELIGFMSMIHAKNHVEGHFLGYQEESNHEYKLYSRMLYDMVALSIEAKTPLLNMGRTALEIKTTVGAVPHEANLYLKITNALFNRIATPVMQSIKTEPFVVRHPFKDEKEE